MKARRIDFHGRLDGKQVLPDGTVRYVARLTRTGVFDYGDHKELRLAEDVFSPKALDSFKGLALTDGHVAWIDSGNWRTHAVGHVGDDVHAEPPYVVASVIVKDQGMLAKIDRGERAEISMGYNVDLEDAPGRTDAGEEYDAIQRNIVGNHAALGPRDWGRAGPNVRLLDGAAYAPEDMSTTQRIDAPATATDTKDLDNARADAAAARADADAVRKERDTARAERDDARKRADTLEAERDAARRDADKAKADAEAQKKDEAARVDARVALVLDARKVLGADADLKGKSDREIRIAVLQKIDSKVDFAGKSDEYVSAAFDLAARRVSDENGALAAVRETSMHPTQTKSKIDEAYERAEAEARKAAQAGPPTGAMLLVK